MSRRTQIAVIAAVLLVAPCIVSLGALVAQGAPGTSLATAVPPENAAAHISLAAFQSEHELHGNTNSHIFHKWTCRYYNCKHCTKIFNTREEAIAAGYRPCKICNP